MRGHIAGTAIGATRGRMTMDILTLIITRTAWCMPTLPCRGLTYIDAIAMAFAIRTLANSATPRPDSGLIAGYRTAARGIRVI